MGSFLHRTKPQDVVELLPELLQVMGGGRGGGYKYYHQMTTGPMSMSQR